MELRAVPAVLEVALETAMNSRVTSACCGHWADASSVVAVCKALSWLGFQGLRHTHVCLWTSTCQ